MAVLSVTRNSKENFLGGGMGVLIPLRKPQPSNSEKNSQNTLSQQHQDQIAQEAQEQMGYPPEMEESDSTTGHEGGNKNG